MEIYPITHNIGDERSEHPLISIFIPKGIEITKIAENWEKALWIAKAKPVGEFMDAYCFNVDYINVDQFVGLGGLFVLAKKKGTYKLIVEIKEKSGKSEHELILEVD